MGRLIVVFAALWLAASASAQDEVLPKDRARQLFDDGAAAYEEGRYEDAIPLWEESWRLSMQPLILYNLANAYERAGRLEDALDHLERYSSSAPRDEEAMLNKRIDALEVRVAAIQAERDRAAAEAAKRDAEALAERQRIEQERMAAQAAADKKRSPAGWVVGGVGAAALATGAGFAVAAGNSRSQLAAQCVDGPDGGLCLRDAEPFVGRNGTQRALAWTGLGLGAVGLGVGGVLIAVPLDSHRIGLSLGGRW